MNSSKQNILFISHAYYNKGGVEEHVRDLSFGLGENFNCFILTPVFECGKIPHYQLINKGLVKEVFPANHPVQYLSPLNDEFAIDALERTIKKVQPALVHVHHLQNWPLLTLKFLIETSIPIIFTAHDYHLATPIFTMEFSEHPKDLLSKEYAVKLFGKDISDYLKVRRQTYLESLNRLAKIVVPSISTRSEMAKIIATEYKVISHGIKKFRPRKPIVTNGSLTFGYLGSLIRQKGWETLLKGFKIAKAKSPHISLKIFGSGIDRESVMQDREVEYCGSYSRKDLPEILSQFQIGIVPSIFKETFCYSLAEMQQGQLPVIASAIGAIPEKIDEESGYLFEAGNAEMLAEKILLMEEKYLFNDWEVPEPKSIEIMCADYTNLYQTIIN